MRRMKICPFQCNDIFRPHAQDIYREAFNHAFSAYPAEEERAHRIAWAAIKRSYVKVGAQAGCACDSPVTERRIAIHEKFNRD